MLQPTNKLSEIQQTYSSSTPASFKAVIYGESGSGKTHLAGTCKKPALVFSWDPGGATTLERHYGKDISSGQLLIDTRWEQWSPNGDSYPEFHKQLQALDKDGSFDHLQTVVLDSFTPVNDAILSWITNKTPEKAMRIQDWGKFASEVTKTFRVLLSLSCDLIVLAHVENTKDDLTGEIIANLGVSGNHAKRTIPVVISEIYRLKEPEKPPLTVRELYTVRSGRYRAKTRLSLKPIISNPNLAEIQDEAHRLATEARTIGQEGS